MNWSQYHDSSKITEELLLLGKLFLERFGITYWRCDPKEMAIVHTAGYAWPRPEGNIYPRTNGRYNHSFMKTNLPLYTIFDNYEESAGDFLKDLAPDYDLLPGYVLIVEKKSMPTIIDYSKGNGLKNTAAAVWRFLVRLFYKLTFME